MATNQNQGVRSVISSMTAEDVQIHLSIQCIEAMGAMFDCRHEFDSPKYREVVGEAVEAFGKDLMEYGRSMRENKNQMKLV